MLHLVRKKPGTSGKGSYFHIEVRPSTDFTSFYTKDVGRRGHSLLVLGKKKEDGQWATHKWLIHKNDAYVSDRGRLKSEDRRVKQILDYVDGNLTHKEKDIFYVRPHRSLSEEKHDCSPEECPDMYFENYEDYEQYEEERMKYPTYVE